VYFPTRMHTDAHSMHSHIRKISRGTADNERGCLSPFVTAVPASMHTESLSYFSISLSLFRSSTSPGFHLYQASPRTTNHPYLSGLIRIIDVFWWTQYFIFWLTRKSQLILWNFSIKIFLLYNISETILYSTFWDTKYDIPTLRNTSGQVREKRCDLKKGAFCAVAFRCRFYFDIICICDLTKDIAREVWIIGVKQWFYCVSRPPPGLFRRPFALHEREPLPTPAPSVMIK